MTDLRPGDLVSVQGVVKRLDQFGSVIVVEVGGEGSSKYHFPVSSVTLLERRFKVGDRVTTGFGNSLVWEVLALDGEAAWIRRDGPGGPARLQVAISDLSPASPKEQGEGTPGRLTHFDPETMTWTEPPSQFPTTTGNGDPLVLPPSRLSTAAPDGLVLSP